MILIISFKASGCNAGGSLACQNGGSCSNNGICICVLGYTGSTCATYIGCQAGGSLACINGGSCVGTTCQCIFGYSGQTCSNCKSID